MTGCSELTFDAAALEVFCGQLAIYPDLAAMNIDELAQYSRLSETGRRTWPANFMSMPKEICVLHSASVKTTRSGCIRIMPNGCCPKICPAQLKICLRAELERLEGELG